MKNLYAKFTEKSFRLIACIMLATADLISCAVLYLRAADKKAFLEGWQEMEKTGALKMLSGDPSQLANQVHGMLIQSVLLTCALILLLHWVIYLTYYFEKRLPYVYLRIVTWFMAIFSLFSGISMLVDVNLFGVIFLMLTFDYLFVAYGLRLFPVSSYIKKLEQ